MISQVYFFIYTVRVKGWSFGFGALFRALGSLVNMIKAPFKGKSKNKDQQE
jgi:ATP-binding cassette subfamily G (WHITE) protein 2 (SNQ2)